MCKISECLTDGDIRTLSRGGAIEVKVGYIDGRPWSALIIDARGDEHLHFPYVDLIGVIGRLSPGFRKDARTALKLLRKG